MTELVTYLKLEFCWASHSKVTRDERLDDKRAARSSDVPPRGLWLLWQRCYLLPALWSLSAVELCGYYWVRWGTRLLSYRWSGRNCYEIKFPSEERSEPSFACTNWHSSFAFRYFTFRISSENCVSWFASVPSVNAGLYVRSLTHHS
jgi:hypothetical protein